MWGPPAVSEQQESHGREDFLLEHLTRHCWATLWYVGWLSSWSGVRATGCRRPRISVEICAVTTLLCYASVGPVVTIVRLVNQSDQRKPRPASPPLRSLVRRHAQPGFCRGNRSSTDLPSPEAAVVQGSCSAVDTMVATVTRRQAAPRLRLLSCSASVSPPLRNLYKLLVFLSLSPH